jgi:basic amino acid/polyamine antiporter, APA family
MAFLVGVAIALITGLAYAELVTKYPQAAGAPSWRWSSSPS